MAGRFSQGPGVYRNEIDLSEVTTPVGTSVGAFVGKAYRGPVNRRVLITRDRQLVQEFGEPDEKLDHAIYGALEFLKESNSLYFVRATSGTEGYANVAISAAGTATSLGISAKPTTALLAIPGYEDGNAPNDIKDIEDASLAGNLLLFASIGPGKYGNNIGIQIVTSANDVSAGFDWKFKYDDAPDTDTDPIWKKIFRVNVFVKPDNAVNFASVSGSPVESFYVSRQKITDTSNNQLYIKDVINGVSKYIYVKDDIGIANTIMPTGTAVVGLSGGTDNFSLPPASIQSAWGLFKDREKVSVNILVCTDTGNKNSSNYATQLVVGNIAAKRMDAIAVVQIDHKTDTNPDSIKDNAGFGYNNASYVAAYAGWDLIFDAFNGVNVYIPKCIYGAALMARTDAVANVWNAPAGVNRGVIPSIGQNVIWSGTQLGIFRDNNINTSKFIRGIGNVMWMQRTALRKNSALSDINVRRLLNFVETTIEESLLSFIHESNNEKTRLRVVSLVGGFLQTVAAGGGFNTDEDAGYLVVCDKTNNTPERINNNELVIDIYVKPIKTVEFITLNTIITKSGVTFQELIG